MVTQASCSLHSRDFPQAFPHAVRANNVKPQGQNVKSHQPIHIQQTQVDFYLGKSERSILQTKTENLYGGLKPHTASQVTMVMIQTLRCYLFPWS